MADSNHLVCIVGPTAVGKTGVTIDLAKHFNTEVISADSRQFFKEMTIGTAKPSLEEQAGITHHFIDSHSVTEGLSAGKYEKQCIELLHDLFQKKNPLLLTGGSGLYIQAVVDGLPHMPEIPEAIRDELNSKMHRDGIEPLQDELKKVDPKYYDEVDLSNPQRVIRALEVFYTTKKPFSSLRAGKAKKRFFKTIKIGLDRPREELYMQINSRVDKMMASGLLEEVKALKNHQHLPALQTVGYKELFDFLDQKVSLDEAVELIKRNTRRYAKRQMTWFRKDEQIKWFHPDDVNEINDYIVAKMIK